MRKLIQDIESQALLKYGSSRTPHYFEVSTPSCGARSLKEAIEHIAEAQDYSDVNDDVSYRLAVNGSIGSYEVLISWVGNYVAILKHCRNSGARVISSGGKDHVLNKVIERMALNGFAILDKDVLESKMDFTLINSDCNLAPVYKILFTDDDLRLL